MIDVLGVGGRAEHLVGDGEQQLAVRDERLGGGVQALDFACVTRCSRLCHTHRTPVPPAL